jgi:hypothetical protein
MEAGRLNVTKIFSRSTMKHQAIPYRQINVWTRLKITQKNNLFVYLFTQGGNLQKYQKFPTRLYTTVSIHSDLKSLISRFLLTHGSKSHNETPSLFLTKSLVPFASITPKTAHPTES